MEALTRWVAALIDELVAGDVCHFVICPGSRSTPLALAVARHPAARTWVLLDERSAGFFALGMARQHGHPVALICTSGTAAANFLPAVAEADLARVPLLILTADRPPELLDNGAPQTIDQVRLYGPRTRWFCALPTPADTPELLRYVRTVAARAVAVSQSAPAGPVHLNLPFRDPLVPNRAMLQVLFKSRGNSHAAPPNAVNVDGGEDAAPMVHVVAASRRLEDEELRLLSAFLSQTRCGLIICGPACPPNLAPAVARLAARFGYPILADPLSGVRHGPHDRQFVLSAYDAFLRDERFTAHHAPALVLRFGAMPTAKPVLQFLQRHPTVHQIVVDEGAGWREPTGLAAEHLACDPLWLCDALVAQPSDFNLQATAFSPQTASTLWAHLWLSAEQATRSAIAAALTGRETISEPGVFAELGALLPDGATLFVGNSMPVRDCDTFFPSNERHVTIIGNRGANGIDGLVSTALGAAAAGAKPLVLVLGDLSLYHDSNGLLAAKLHALDATIVLINNNGGGIFTFLPQASETDCFELLFGTPHGLDFAPLAELYGARYTLAATWTQFRAAVTAGIEGRGLHLVEVRTERGQNLTDHRTLWPLVSAALAQVGLR